jgi:entericidin B
MTHFTFRHLRPVFWLGLLCTLAACNTVRGVGKDIQKAGEVIEGSAEKGR